MPPPPERVAELLADMERFIHDTATDLPPMVKVALIHAQFETIHPFLDGNGRIGRLLITVLFEYWGVLSEPLLYVSAYLKQHQAEYYRRLSAIRTDGDWESWVTFFWRGWQAPRAIQRKTSLKSPASLPLIVNGCCSPLRQVRPVIVCSRCCR